MFYYIYFITTLLYLDSFDFNIILSSQGHKSCYNETRG